MTRAATTPPEAPAVEPEATAEVPSPTDSRKRVYVYDTETGDKLPYPVPLSHLDGRFPRLKEVPSTATKGS